MIAKKNIQQQQRRANAGSSLRECQGSEVENEYWVKEKRREEIPLFFSLVPGRLVQLG